MSHASQLVSAVEDLPSIYMLPELDLAMLVDAYQEEGDFDAALDAAWNLRAAVIRRWENTIANGLPARKVVEVDCDRVQTEKFAHETRVPYGSPWWWVETYYIGLASRRIVAATPDASDDAVIAAAIAAHGDDYYSRGKPAVVVLRRGLRVVEAVVGAAMEPAHV